MGDEQWSEATAPFSKGDVVRVNGAGPGAFRLLYRVRSVREERGVWRVLADAIGDMGSVEAPADDFVLEIGT